MMELVARVSARLEAAGLRLALAESCTGGLLAARLTDRAGASAFLTAGLVTYSDDAKQDLLSVRKATLQEHGAVSEAVALEMLDGALARGRAGAGVAITGVAGPGGGSDQKPVGTVWIAAAAGGSRSVACHRFGGDRAAIRDAAVRAALETLDRLLAGDGPS